MGGGRRLLVVISILLVLTTSFALADEGKGVQLRKTAIPQVCGDKLCDDVKGIDAKIEQYLKENNLEITKAESGDLAKTSSSADAQNLVSTINELIKQLVVIEGIQSGKIQSTADVQPYLESVFAGPAATDNYFKNDFYSKIPVIILQPHTEEVSPAVASDGDSLEECLADAQKLEGTAAKLAAEQCRSEFSESSNEPTESSLQECLADAQKLVGDKAKIATQQCYEQFGESDKDEEAKKECVEQAEKFYFECTEDKDKSEDMCKESFFAMLGCENVEIVDGNLVVNGKVIADEADFGDMTADTADIGKLQTDEADIDKLDADDADIGNLDVDVAHIDNLDVDTAHVDDLDVDTAHIDDLDVGQGTFDDISTGTLDVPLICSESGTITICEDVELVIEGNAHIKNDLTVDGQIIGMPEVDVDLSQIPTNLIDPENDSLLVDGNTTIIGNLTVYGNITSKQYVFANHTLANTTTTSKIIPLKLPLVIDGNTTITGNLTVLGNITSDSKITLDDLQLDTIIAQVIQPMVEPLYINGNTTINGNLTIAGNITAPLFVGGNTTVYGNITSLEKIISEESILSPQINATTLFTSQINGTNATLPILIGQNTTIAGNLTTLQKIISQEAILSPEINTTTLSVGKIQGISKQAPYAKELWVSQNLTARNLINAGVIAFDKDTARIDLYDSSKNLVISGDLSVVPAYGVVTPYGGNIQADSFTIGDSGIRLSQNANSIDIAAGHGIRVDQIILGEGGEGPSITLLATEYTPGQPGLQVSGNLYASTFSGENLDVNSADIDTIKTRTLQPIDESFGTMEPQISVMGKLYANTLSGGNLDVPDAEIGVIKTNQLSSLDDSVTPQDAKITISGTLDAYQILVANIGATIGGEIMVNDKLSVQDLEVLGTLTASSSAAMPIGVQGMITWLDTGKIELADDANFFKIGGTSTIHHIVPKSTGSIVMLYFQTPQFNSFIMTCRNGSNDNCDDEFNLALNGDFRAASEGDSLILISNGGMWTELARVEHPNVNTVYDTTDLDRQVFSGIISIQNMGTFDSLPNASDGTVLTILSSGNNNFVDCSIPPLNCSPSTNLNLAGNFDPTNEGTLVLVFYNNIWHEISRSDNS